MDSYLYNDVIVTLKNYFAANKEYSKTICEKVWSLAPKTMLLATVTFAIEQYKGNFWSDFGKTIELYEHNLWRKNFMKALKKQNMYIFKGSSIQRYIRNILGHAGIPRSQVKPFVNNIILPAIENDYSAEEVQQIIVKAENYN
ncbi:hypothetical protein [Rummeliibacillus suwonensis]|uniref:hypothetical protein n=1 Tax=Rummeliibacillus suwonensis TaxID=1306154 RepID=UPI0011B6168D|nr:hypothetical protein [Rummeliibacillus suwonensis]